MVQVMYHSMTVPSQGQQLVPPELLALVLASNPEPPEPLQLDVGHGKAAHITAPCSLPAGHSLPAWLLPTSKGFHSSLDGCLETPEAETQITKLVEQAACCFEGKLQ